MGCTHLAEWLFTCIQLKFAGGLQSTFTPIVGEKLYINSVSASVHKILEAKPSTSSCPINYTSCPFIRI